MSATTSKNNKEPVVGMSLQDFMPGLVNIVSADPMRRAQMTQGLNDIGVAVQEIAQKLSDGLRNVFAPAAVGLEASAPLQTATLAAPAPKMDISTPGQG